MNISQRAYPWYWGYVENSMEESWKGTPLGSLLQWQVQRCPASVVGLSRGLGYSGGDASAVVSVVDSDCDWLAQLGTWLSLGLTEKAMDFNYKQLFALFFIYFLFYFFLVYARLKQKTSLQQLQ